MSAQEIQEILLGGGGILLIAMTLIQVAPIKINPWSKLAKILGRAINADVLQELDEIKTKQKETRAKLEEHIRVDDERNADDHRARILRFNIELIRELPHTKEDFNEIMAKIDFYEKYCHEHPEYENNRAVCAIKNIKRVYMDRLEKHDFIEE